MKHLLRLIGVLSLPILLVAHDTWLIPSVFRTVSNKTVLLRLATGEAFPASEVAVGPERIARFTIRTTTETKAVEDYHVDGTFLIAEVTPVAAGHAILVAETKPLAFELEPEVFNEYLRAEELKDVIEARAQRAETHSPGRERYRKIAKAVPCVGDARDSSFRQPEGLWLEIGPESSPCRLRVGDSLAVRVLFEGRPLSGGRLVAGYEGGAGHDFAIKVRTDAEGRATVKFDHAGPWFLRILHMVPASGDAEADWHSAFGTLTFEVSP